MTCNNKNCGCAKRAQPREELIDMSAITALGDIGAEALRGLLAVARSGLTGLAKLDLPAGELRTLARTIAVLYEERNRLQNLLASMETVDGINVASGPTDVKIGFGPDKKYTLIIPVTGAIAKQELATGLRNVADVLAPDPRQMPLPLEY
jgi:hypothetical protein